jgi:hypothetical protein
MASKHVSEQLDPLRGRHIRQAEQSGVAGAAVHESPEISIDGDKDPILLRRHLEDCSVSRVRPEP